MARIRAIKPEFAYDEELAQLPYATRLFYILLWTQMDREGRGEDRPAMLCSKIYPYDKGANAEQFLAQLNPKFVLRYEAAGKKYLQVRNWEKHERPHSTESKSVIPPPDKALLTVKQQLSNASPTTKGIGNRELGIGNWELEERIAPSPAVSEPAILDFPTVGSGPKVWGLTAAKVKEYEGSYPGVDVLAECRKALQWCRDNPTKRKTAKGMPAFLGRWIGKQQDAGRSYGPSRQGVPGRVVGAAAPVPGKYDKYDKTAGGAGGA